MPKKPVAKKPATKKPATEAKPVAKKPVAKKPVAKAKTWLDDFPIFDTIPIIRSYSDPKGLIWYNIDRDELCRPGVPGRRAPFARVRLNGKVIVAQVTWTRRILTAPHVLPLGLAALVAEAEPGE